MERVQFKLEFVLHGSINVMYEFFTVPSYLVRWFCDEVDITDDVYTFSWDGAEEVAEVIEDIEGELIKFRWEEADDPEEYLEFKMSSSPITAETILEITDYCDADEVDDTKRLWETQIDKLKKEMGA